MKKKQIFIVFNPYNMGENRKNRKKTMDKHNKKSKDIYRHSRNAASQKSLNNYPETKGAENCQESYREDILYNGVTDINNIEKYTIFFDKHNISTEILYKFFMESKAKTRIKGDYIEIICHEDTWRIPLNIKSNKVCLEHNNYVRNFFGERHIIRGYHKQTISDKTLVGVLMYIMNYNYNQFHNPKQILAQNIKNIFLEEFEKAFEE